MSVGAIYDRLSLFERPGRGDHYPVHKHLHKLSLEALLSKWLVNRSGLNILDAGCGNGYLLRKLVDTKHFGLGVTISKNEYLQASALEKHNLRFKCGSYDQLKDGAFDIILAVESIKHSPNLEKTFTTFKSILNDQGEIWLVEDVQIKPDKNIEKIKNLWQAPSWIRENDWVPHFSGAQWSTEWKDLTPYVQYRNPMLLSLQIAWCSLMGYLKPSDRLFYHIYQGAFLLEQCYSRQSMKYGIIRIIKNN
jgi:SAM-dependent methyltransferase